LIKAELNIFSSWMTKDKHGSARS